ESAWHDYLTGLAASGWGGRFMRRPPDVRRLRVRRRRGCVGQLEGGLVDVAPVPVLARLERPDDRVARCQEVAGGVPAGRVVAAADVAALLADAEVDPVPPARGETVL